MLMSKYNQGDECQAVGCGVLYDGVHAIAHNKIVIIDESIVVGGSFNHSAGAEEHNAENMTVTRSPEIAAKYLANFKLHQSHSKPQE